MNVKKIQEIVNHPLYDDEMKERLIVRALAEDETLIPTLLEILAAERVKKGKVIREMNFQLSRAHLTIEHPEVNKDQFIEKELIKFFHKYTGEFGVGHCFANMDKYPKPEKEEPKLSDYDED